jgi:lycopene beta-cyclase
MHAYSTNIYKTALEPTQRVDLAIIGGGCAGLSLARELADRQTPQSIIILEPRTQYQDDRSWCFWSTPEHALSILVSHSWSTWRFGLQGQAVDTKNSSLHPYQYIRSADFYRDCWKKIAQCPSITASLGTTVTCVKKQDDGWHIDTTQGSFFATQVIDTRPPSSTHFAQSTLYQCFLGAEIQLGHGINTEHFALELMTDMRLLDGEFCFTYLLPLGQDRLLIELTLFASRPYPAEALREAFDQLLAERGLTDSPSLRIEYGNLPMGLPVQRSDPPRAGLGGGALRPSSGYGFMRIQRWAEQCAEHYCKQGTVIPQTLSNFWLQKMDQLFLSVIQSQPSLAPTLFNKLLGKTQTERFIRFMNDRASLIDYFHIVMCLPKKPFIQALLSNLFQRK